MTTTRRTVLDKSWFWKQRSTSIENVLDEIEAQNVSRKETEATARRWNLVQRYPSEVHVELMTSGVIPDPYLGFNEHAVQCQFHLTFSSRGLSSSLGVGDVEWLYKCTFPYDSALNEGQKAFLEFEGLDTLCDVYLVGSKGQVSTWLVSNLTLEWRKDSFGW